MIPVEEDDVITTLTKKVIKFLFCSNKSFLFHSNTSQINLQFIVIELNRKLRPYLRIPLKLLEMLSG